jgi:hypothetical protein
MEVSCSSEVLMKVHDKKYLSGYADGQLTGKQKMLFENHLENCGACVRELDALMRFKSSISGFSDATKPSAAPQNLVLPARIPLVSHTPVYDTTAYKLGLAIFMNIFMLKIENFSGTLLIVLGLYTLFHLFLYLTRKIMVVKKLGLA